MNRHSQFKAVRFLRCILVWINGLFPFLWPIRGLFKNFNYIRGPLLYIRDYVNFSRTPKDPRFPLHFINSNPCFFDRFDTAGGKPRHYFLQDIWAARRIFESGVQEHFDIGSRIDGFVAHCAVFCKVKILDIRALPDLDQNIQFIQADATDLKNIASDSLSSVSSLHVFEHIGLGRYGDPLGATNLDKAIQEVTRVLAPGAPLYFAVPIGIQRLEFNAHRIFGVETVIELFKTLKLAEFSAIDDQDNLVLHANPSDYARAEYSCGLFVFKK